MKKLFTLDQGNDLIDAIFEQCYGDEITLEEAMAESFLVLDGMIGDEVEGLYAEDANKYKNYTDDRIKRMEANIAQYKSLPDHQTETLQKYYDSLEEYREKKIKELMKKDEEQDKLAKAQAAKSEFNKNPVTKRLNDFTTGIRNRFQDAKNKMGSKNVAALRTESTYTMTEGDTLTETLYEKFDMGEIDFSMLVECLIEVYARTELFSEDFIDDNIARLKELKSKGAVTDDEYKKQVQGWEGRRANVDKAVRDKEAELEKERKKKERLQRIPNALKTAGKSVMSAISKNKTGAFSTVKESYTDELDNLVLEAISDNEEE